jgi:hypothetical protein
MKVVPKLLSGVEFGNVSAGVGNTESGGAVVIAESVRGEWNASLSPMIGY